MLLAYVHAKLEARITLQYVQCKSHIYRKIGLFTRLGWLAPARQLVTLASHNCMWLARSAVVVTGCDDRDIVVAGAGGIDMEVVIGGRDVVGATGSDDRGVVEVVVNVVEAGASDSGTVEGDGASGSGMVFLIYLRCLIYWSSDVLLYEQTPSTLRCPVLSIMSCSSALAKYNLVALVALRE